MPPTPKPKRVRHADGTLTVHGKAPNGTGSVYVDSTSGRWVATWVDRTGRRRRVSRQDRRSVLLARDAAQAADAAGASTDDRLTPNTPLAVLVGWYVDTVARHRVRPTSLARYEDRARRIVSTLGDVPLSSLSVERLTTWQAQLLRSGLAPGTVRDARTLLGQVLAQAVELDLLDRSPLDRVAPVKVERRAAVALTPDDVRRLLSAAAGHRHAAVFALLFVQGWRISEVLGLCWEDVDLTAGTAVVRRACVHVDGVGLTFGPPKSAGAAGVHHLAPGVVRLLEDRRRAQAAERTAAGRLWQSVHQWDGAPVSPVFTTPAGGLVLRQQIARNLKHVATAAGLDSSLVSTHTGRRSVVTALRRDGVPMEDIARHVGHASPATTAGYVRGLGERPADVARRAAAMLDVPPDH